MKNHVGDVMWEGVTTVKTFLQYRWRHRVRSVKRKGIYKVFYHRMRIVPLGAEGISLLVCSARYALPRSHFEQWRTESLAEQGNASSSLLEYVDHPLIVWLIAYFVKESIKQSTGGLHILTNWCPEFQEQTRGSSAVRQIVRLCRQLCRRGRIHWSSK